MGVLKAAGGAEPRLSGASFLSTDGNGGVRIESSLGVVAERLPHWKTAIFIIERYKEEILDYSPEFALFRSEDGLEWTIFTLVFFALLLFDNFVLHRKEEILSFGRACLYTCFWVVCAGIFNLYIYFTEGEEAAFAWGTGYLLEWMLSLDNLFVFHLVFKMYKTPDHLKHKPLFYGIIGAIVFRMIFFIVEESLFHAVWWMHIVFGVFLVYTGIRSAATDDDDDDPRNNFLVSWIASKIPLINDYDTAGGRFFVCVPKSQNGEETDDDKMTAPRPRHQVKATLLVLVVICLEITDVVFAVDSVSAIVAQIPDLYLAYTACVFAMLGLRASFFVIDELVRMFSLLKYGVSMILVFIGIKLMVGKQLHVSNAMMLLILVGTVGVCVVGSIVQDGWQNCTKKLAADQEATPAGVQEGTGPKTVDAATSPFHGCGFSPRPSTTPTLTGHGF